MSSHVFPQIVESASMVASQDDVNQIERKQTQLSGVGLASFVATPCRAVATATRANEPNTVVPEFPTFISEAAAVLPVEGSADTALCLHALASRHGGLCLPEQTQDVSPALCAAILDDCLRLEDCPWRHLAEFLTTADLALLGASCAALRSEVTAEDDTGRLRLLAPIVQLRLEMAEAELDRISLPHTRVLRIWSRLSFDATVRAVGAHGAKALRSLEKIAIQGCPLHPLDMQSLLVPVLSVARGLKMLNLEKNQLGDATVSELVASGALEAAPALETLNIRFNRISNGGAIAIARSSGAAKLRWINFKMNCIGDEGAIALAGMLRDNRSMIMLNLRRQNPGLTDRSAVAFADVLRSGSAIEQLRFRRNRITDAGATAFARAITDRFGGSRALPAPRLELDLEENRVGEAGGLALLRSLAPVPRELARIEILLHRNPTTFETLGLAATSSGQASLAGDPRLIFETKPESAL